VLACMCVYCVCRIESGRSAVRWTCSVFTVPEDEDDVFADVITSRRVVDVISNCVRRACRLVVLLMKMNIASAEYVPSYDV